MIATYVSDEEGNPISVTRWTNSGQQLTYFYHYNQHGDAIALTDNNGNVVATFAYDVWRGPTEYDSEGNVAQIGTWAGTPSDGLFFLFGGMLYDTLAGIYLTKTRAYDPKRGRFLERDILDEDKKDGYRGFPFGADAIGTNLYGWCKNNPVTRIDPSGEWSFSGIGRFVGRAVGRIFGRPSLGARIGGTIGGIVDYALGYSGISLGGGYSGGGYGWAGHARRAAEIRQQSAPAPAPKPAPKIVVKVADIQATSSQIENNNNTTSSTHQGDRANAGHIYHWYHSNIEAPALMTVSAPTGLAAGAALETACITGGGAAAGASTYGIGAPGGAVIGGTACAPASGVLMIGGAGFSYANYKIWEGSDTYKLAKFGWDTSPLGMLVNSL